MSIPVEENSVILDDSAENEATFNLLDHHDGFDLKPKKLVEDYKEKRTSTTAQYKLFVHTTNFVATEHVSGNKRLGKCDKLQPSSYLHVDMHYDQKRLLNTTPQDAQLSEIIAQAQGDKARKREEKRHQEVISGNINSYSSVLNGKQQMEMVTDYNDLAASLGPLNSKKDAKALASKEKKNKDLVEKAINKAMAEEKYIEKREGMLPGFEQELQVKTTNDILKLRMSRLREYIQYFFQEKVTNLAKKKANELVDTLRPLLQQHYGVIEVSPIQAEVVPVAHVMVGQ